jgi:RNA polymerase sigma factor (sigma-70 family)
MPRLELGRPCRGAIAVLAGSSSGWFKDSDGVETEGTDRTLVCHAQARPWLTTAGAAPPRPRGHPCTCPTWSATASELPIAAYACPADITARGITSRLSCIYGAMVTTTSGAGGAWAALMRNAAEGDEVAFARIVDAHHADMTSVCFVVTGGDAELTQEAVQSAWTIAWRKLDTLRDPDRLRPWLVSIAVNEARQLARRQRRGRVLEISISADLSTGSSSDPAGRAADIDLRNALARMKPEDRVLIALRYGAGFDSTELARALGMSPSGTRARLARLLTSLRSELGDG